MSLKIGIVGLPNVGKSTLFNALTQSSNAEAQNYPFCTIDPNVGIVEVPDYRIDKLSDIINPEKTVPAVVEFVDIAGLVKGASTGEGLGNKFLANIRECQAIAQVVRSFSDPDVIHVHGEVNPKSDKEVIESELILADLQTLEKRLDKARHQAKSGDSKMRGYVALLEKVEQSLNEGKRVRELDLTEDERESIKDLFLLTEKPILYIANVGEDELGSFSRDDLGKEMELKDHEKLIPISAKLEEELVSLSKEEAKEYLTELGLNETGLNILIKEAYDTLGLHTFFTAGVKEVRSWTIKQGDLAPQAAGAIHTDFEKGFIRAETIAYDDYIAHGGESAAKEKGLMRAEGKDYLVKDGDVMLFRFTS